MKNLFIKTAALMTVFALFLPVSLNAQTGTVSTFAGTGSHGYVDGMQAQFNLPRSVFGDGSRLFVADTNNNLLRIIDEYRRTGLFSGIVLSGGSAGFPAGNHLDGTVAEAMFRRPTDGVINAAGLIFITDSENHAIRIVDGNNVYTYAGGHAGHRNGSIAGAMFNLPGAIAIDESGNMYVADTLNHCIRFINFETGTVSDLAGSAGTAGYSDGSGTSALFDSPMGIAVSPDGGTVYVSDTGNHLIRMIQDGQVSTLAGTFSEELIEGNESEGPIPAGGFADGPSARFNMPMGLTLLNGTLVVADSSNHRIRTISSTGFVTTIAGSGEPGHADGAATSAEFHLPMGVFAVDDTLYIADTGNNLIRILK